MLLHGLDQVSALDFSALESVGGVLSLIDNDQLSDLSAFSGLLELGGLEIDSNTNLTDLTGLYGATATGGFFSARFNPSFSDSAAWDLYYAIDGDLYMTSAEVECNGVPENSCWGDDDDSSSGDDDDAADDDDSAAPTGLQCDLSLVDTWPLTSNIQGLAYLDPYLYAIDRDPGPVTTIRAFDPSGSEVTSFASPLGLTSVGLGASSTHLYLDDEGGGQLIHEIDPTTEQVTSTISSSITGGNRGLAYLSGSLWHLGVQQNSGVGFAEIQLPGGVALGFFAAVNSINSDDAASDGVNLMYTAFDDECAFGFDPCAHRLYIVDVTGQPICDQVLLTGSPWDYNIFGLAASPSQLFVADRSAGEIRVYAGP
jgi:hypothetical protein